MHNGKCIAHSALCCKVCASTVIDNATWHWGIVYSVYCTMYSVYCTMYSVRQTLCKVYSVAKSATCYSQGVGGQGGVATRQTSVSLHPDGFCIARNPDCRIYTAQFMLTAKTGPVLHFHLQWYLFAFALHCNISLHCTHVAFAIKNSYSTIYALCKNWSCFQWYPFAFVLNCFALQPDCFCINEFMRHKFCHINLHGFTFQLANYAWILINLHSFHSLHSLHCICAFSVAAAWRKK